MVDVNQRFFSPEHIWLAPLDGGNELRLGISEFLQDQLGDITHVHLPVIGQNYYIGDSLFVIESMKSATEFYSLLTGVVTAVNLSLTDTPQLINQDPFDTGWLCQMNVSDITHLPETLMSLVAYEAMLDG
ncbi:MAG TPA: glycine cleavage system protein H [Methylophaga aminisulfidivorans]|uniref:glycine cleavage system protein H n=1 Tax=Methylophaga TaxID=40222 RepID=UPI001754761E|nr:MULTISPECIES: glycine cleavage system protein H [Methylophaga]HIC45750.1 glycine cleavage system protein H [Methylophaga sp.]HIM39958.1 glycine cleavage system protein H [Methylophaga aminisulfidivorans]